MTARGRGQGRVLDYVRVTVELNPTDMEFLQDDRKLTYDRDKLRRSKVTNISLVTRAVEMYIISRKAELNIGGETELARNTRSTTFKTIGEDGDVLYDGASLEDAKMAKTIAMKHKNLQSEIEEYPADSEEPVKMSKWNRNYKPSKSDK